LRPGKDHSPGGAAKSMIISTVKLIRLNKIKITQLDYYMVLESINGKNSAF
jgi:hypothetical protein